MLLHRSSLAVLGRHGTHHNSHRRQSAARTAMRRTPQDHQAKFGCMVLSASVQTAPVLKSGMQSSVDPDYLAAANYLKSIGFTNTAEIARVLDIAMNPNSLFVQYNDAKRSTNVNVSEPDLCRSAAAVGDMWSDL
eukprot:GHUV01029002.1.p1 GENE.GHUV01029002.1~~GHUV01029002.1.p1  ORF type:complete len:135 (+),score=21.59 GHUV01029002.1:152-556(+)